MPDDVTPDSGLEPEQSGETDDRPEWLPEQFDTPEAFAKSYQEAQRKITEMGQDRAGLEAQLDDLYGRVSQMEENSRRQPAAPQPGYDPDHDPYLIAYENAYNQGDARAMLAISTGLAQMAAKREAAELAQKIPQPGADRDWDSYAYIAEQTAINEVGGPEEWAKYRDAVGRESKYENFEGLSAQDAGKKLARLHKMVKADDIVENQQTLAQQMAEADRQRKLAAQSESGRNSPFNAPTKDEAAVDRIIKAAREQSYEGLLRK